MNTTTTTSSSVPFYPTADQLRKDEDYIIAAYCGLLAASQSPELATLLSEFVVHVDRALGIEIYASFLKGGWERGWWAGDF